MPGGLLNIISYGSENLIINGNPSKTFFKQIYKKHTNFGLQRFRIDFEGQRVLNYDSPSQFKFKIPKYAELLWDTYIVVQLPNIYSSLYVYDCSGNDNPKYYNYLDYNDNGLDVIDVSTNLMNNSTNNYKKIIIQGSNNSSGICEYKFKWIKNLGFHMIKEIVIKSSSKIIERYSGETMLFLNERDNNSKKKLVNNMIGNIESLYNPGNRNIINTHGPLDITNTNNKIYPNCIYNENSAEPSIRGRKLYIPIMSWFSQKSHLAFPLIALEYSDLEIEITFRPVSELYTLYDHHKNKYKNNIINYCQGDTSPRYFGIGGIPDITNIKNFLSQPNTKDNRPSTNIWNSDIHLLSTYIFLSNDERKLFASKNHEYLIKNINEYEFKNVMGSERVEVQSKNLVSSYMFRFIRSDVNIRNQWDNYTNWEYDNVSPTDYSIIDINTSAVTGNSYRDMFELSSNNNITTNSLKDICGNIIFSTKNLLLESQKNILINLGILFGGTYREDVLHNGIYNYVEKYSRTNSQAKSGLYIYNFSIYSNRDYYQPSGSQNMNKTKSVIFEFNTTFSDVKKIEDTYEYTDISDSVIEQDNALIRTRGEGAISAIRQNRTNKYDMYKYNYELLIIEERYNVLYIKNGLVELKYAK